MKEQIHRNFPDGFKMTELGPLPQEWEVVRLGEVAEFVRGLSWRKSEETDKQNGKLIISIPNIGEDVINFETKYNHYLIKNIPENKRLHIGDIIFVGSS
ncbi:MAG: restriction endonuclease subunit S, partial [Candidatus Micrarchaeia archaeon]